MICRFTINKQYNSFQFGFFLRKNLSAEKRGYCGVSFGLPAIPLPSVWLLQTEARFSAVVSCQFVKLGEVRWDEMRKVVGQPGENLASIPHPDEVSYVLELEAAEPRALHEHRVLLKIEPFPCPIDLNVAFRVKRTDEGGRALEVASVYGGSEFVFVSELDFVHN